MSLKPKEKQKFWEATFWMNEEERFTAFCKWLRKWREEENE